MPIDEWWERSHLCLWPGGILLIAACALPLAGCGEGQPAAVAEPLVRDSAGITIVETPAAAPELAWRIPAEPALQLGELDGPAEYQLDRIAGVVRMRDGRIAVANGGTSEIRFYDVAGRHLQSVGRPGDGPGEFRLLGGLFRLPDDSLAVWDLRSWRGSVFDSDGRFIRTFDARADGLPAARPLHVLGDGTLLGQGINRFSGEPTTGQRRDTTVYLLLSTDGAVPDTVGRFPGNETYLRVTDGGRTIHFSPVPFGRALQVRAHADRIFVATQDRYEVAVYRPEGTIERLIRRDHTPRRVAPVDIERMRSDRLSRARDEDGRRFEAEMLAGMTIPETMPALGELRVDLLGNLWVEDFRPPGVVASRWTVFDLDGRMLGSIAAPPGLRMHAIGADYVLGTLRDEFGVEYVRLHRLER